VKSKKHLQVSVLWDGAGAPLQQGTLSGGANYTLHQLVAHTEMKASQSTCTSATLTTVGSQHVRSMELHLYS